MLRKLMPIKPNAADAEPRERWGSTYRPERGGWEPDKPAEPNRR